MDHNLMKLRVGIFVLMAMVILGILIVVHSDGWNSQYNLFLKTRNAPGVAKGTPVRKNGILIGRVSDVYSEENPDTGREELTIVLGINEGTKIYSNEIGEIGTGSFLGDAVIEIVVASETEPLGNVVETPYVLPAVVRKDPLEMINSLGDLKPQFQDTLRELTNTGKAVKDTAESIKEFTSSINTAMNDDEGDFKKLINRLNDVSLSADNAMQAWNELFGNLNDIVGDESVKSDIKNSFSELFLTMQGIQATVATTRQQILQIGDNVNSQIDKLNPFTDKLKESGPEILTKVDENLTELREVVAQVKAFTKSLENFKNSDGTVAKLLNEDEAYDALMDALNNVRDVSVRLDPLMNDLRSFTDAIARDPGSLGVRGALDRRPSKTGYKGSAGRDGGWFR